MFYSFVPLDASIPYPKGTQGFSRPLWSYTNIIITSMLASLSVSKEE